MKRTLLTFLSPLLLTIVGCQKMMDPKATDTQFATSCASSKPVDVDSLEIKGANGASPGQTLSYALNEDVSCAPGQSVSWSTPNGKALGAGGRAMLSFNKVGQYVVTAQVQSASTAQPTTVSIKTIVTDGLAINAPQVGMAEVDTRFELVIPAGVSVRSATWNFGDGQPALSGLGPINYQYFVPGTYNVSVTAVLASGDLSVVTRSIQIIAANDTMTCVPQLAVSGPATATVGAPVTLSLFIPDCLKTYTNRLSWDFADGSTPGASQTVQHAYAASGAYHVVVSLYHGESTVPFASLSTDIVASVGTDPGTDDPTTPDLNECSTVGQTRSMLGEIYTEQASCGVNGKRTDSYRDTVVQSCTLVSGIRKWVDSAHNKELVNQGQCTGQACEVPAASLNGADPASLGLQTINGKYYLADGVSKTFYTSTAPEGTCASVAQTRICSNGQLGASSAANLVCHEGCPGFGANGSTKSGVVTGQENVAKTCAFGETGIFDLYTQVSTQVCNEGQVTTTSTTRGSLVTSGQCPTYGWSPTETYSACSADCGGSQDKIFECRSNAGTVVAADRCVSAAPVVSRVCDGNPDAVRRSESAVTTEDGGQSIMCPKNQIGVITQSRDITVTTTYACIDHAVAQASQTRTEGAWVQEKYCRDYVPYRCSADSLSNSAAIGRYQWMLKCKDQVPAIKDFLATFEDLEAGSGKASVLMMKGREVYATFMYLKDGKETTWKAPTKDSASCDVPSGIYVGAVCTASCATPEQQILAQKDKSSKVAYGAIADAWAEKFAYVATLQAQSSMSSKQVVRTAVDNWVTEVIDTDHVILNFTTKSGGVIRLTPNHPVLSDQGAMKLASDFKVGDNLVRLGGAFDPIVSIESTNYFGKVYNVFVKSEAPQKNIVVTNGFLNGTAYFQNEGAKQVNQRLLRANLIRGAF